MAKADGGWGTEPSKIPQLTLNRSEPDEPAASLPPGDQYLLGPNLLVAPINQPSQRRRNVALPPTPGGWVDFETSQTLPGGQTVGLPAPLGSIPLLARAGAFVPMTAYRASTAAFRADTLRLRYFPAPEVPRSAFTVYEDDGHSAQALAQKQYATVQFSGVSTAHSTVISATITGSYPGAPTQRLVQLRVARVAAAPAAVLLADQPLAASAWHFDAGQHELQVAFPLMQQASITLVGLRLLTQPAQQLDPETVTLTAPESRAFATTATLHYVRYVAAGAPGPLRIRNQQGQLVRELPTLAAVGTHTLPWDGRDGQGRPMPPGTYVAELAGQHQQLLRLPPSE